MHDARFDDLAKLLVEYSIRLKRNETVLIEVFDVPDEMTIALHSSGAEGRRHSFRADLPCSGNRALALEASDRQLNLIGGP